MKLHLLLRRSIPFLISRDVNDPAPEELPDQQIRNEKDGVSSMIHELSTITNTLTQ